MATVYSLLTEGLAERLCCSPSEFTPETTFASLGLDSLDLGELLIVLENRLGFEIESDRKIGTIQDLVDIIENIRKKRGIRIPEVDDDNNADDNNADDKNADDKNTDGAAG
ncbi:MAG: hypothetical protein IKE64_14425 [Thermoguttaceae bacterium]|nr:hypothetical protein [Thermoguttaceae bacterium]